MDLRDLPEDWLSAQPHGERVFHFFPCKTPLHGYAVPSGKSWTTGHALAAATRAFGKPPALVVDLTAGAGYYQRTGAPWGPASVYVVIPCKGDGRDDPPPEAAWESFYLAVRRARAADPEAGVLVHCTHGCNRTGYMICRYAVVSGMAASVKEAMLIFARARPWGAEWGGAGGGIYKTLYVTRLCVSMGELPIKEALAWPSGRTARRIINSLPDVWRVPFGNGPVAVPMPEALGKIITNAHDVGDTVRWGLRVSKFDAAASCACVVRATIAAACGCDSEVIAGPQPVALRREHLDLLRFGHSVTWKADGCRLLIAVLEFGTFGLNRRMEVRRIGDPLRGMSHEARMAVCPIVFDAEVVISGERKTIWVHDLMNVHRTRTAGLPFRERTERCAELYMRLRRSSKTRDIAAIHILRKHWFPAHQAPQVLADPRNADRDGLIFCSSDGVFVTGVDRSMYKWKISNTVDFTVSEDDVLLLADGRPAEETCVNPMEAWRGCVVEAAWNYEQRGWFIMHVRPDKVWAFLHPWLNGQILTLTSQNQAKPNSRETYLDTKVAIDDHVTEEDVVNACVSSGRV